MGYSVRYFSRLNKNPWYQWYYQQMLLREEETRNRFYNYGWWDFPFDDLRFQYDYRELDANELPELPVLKVFNDIHWAAFHAHMEDQEKHIHLLFKSSPFGSISHSHGDQNAFTLHAFGETYCGHNGYYVAFSSDMHRLWRRQTLSKNAILVGGKGQFAEIPRDNFQDYFNDKCLAAAGAIVEQKSDARVASVTGDAGAAYREYVPHLRGWLREIHFVDRRYFVVVDRVSLEHPDTITWLLHTTFDFSLAKRGFAITGKQGRLRGEFLSFHGAAPVMKLVEGFDNVRPDEYEELYRGEKHIRLETLFGAEKEQTIVTLLVPEKRGRREEVDYTLSDGKMVFAEGALILELL